MPIIANNCGLCVKQNKIGCQIVLDNAYSLLGIVVLSQSR